MYTYVYVYIFIYTYISSSALDASSVLPSGGALDPPFTPNPEP